MESERTFRCSRESEISVSICKQCKVFLRFGREFYVFVIIGEQYRVSWRLIRHFEASVKVRMEYQDSRIIRSQGIISSGLCRESMATFRSGIWPC
jgi:hypothetical protein